MKSHLIAGIFLMGSFATAAAQDIACPEIPGNPLVNVEVYDGPLSENASLVPDTAKGTLKNGTSTWDVTYVYDAGREVHVLCQFKNQKKTAEINSSAKLKVCEFKTSTKSPARFACK